MGAHAVRRARGPRVRAVVSEPDPQHPRPQAAPGLRGVPDRDRTAERRHRASIRGRNPVGLAGFARSAGVVGMGHDRAPARRRRWPISGKWRGVAVAVDRSAAPGRTPSTGSCRGLGGVTRVWRFDRMATVCRSRQSGRVTASFAGVAKHYGGRRWRSARRGAATARVWWRRSTTLPRNAGGAPWPTTSPSSRLRPAWTASAARAVTPGMRATA